MRQHDRATIHEAMEQQTISVAKVICITPFRAPVVPVEIFHKNYVVFIYCCGLRNAQKVVSVPKIVFQ